MSGTVAVYRSDSVIKSGNDGDVTKYQRNRENFKRCDQPVVDENDGHGHKILNWRRRNVQSIDRRRTVAREEEMSTIFCGRKK